MSRQAVLSKEFLSNFGSATGYPKDKLEGLRSVAKKQFMEMLPPDVKDEQWKYTRISNILKTDYQTISQRKNIAVNQYTFFGKEVTRLVFVDGKYDKSCSILHSEDEIEIIPISEALEKNIKHAKDLFGKTAGEHTGYFTILNATVLNEVVFIHVPPDTVLTQPIELIHITTEQSVAANLRNLIIVGQNSSVEFVNNYNTVNGSAFTNQVTELVLKADAQVKYNFVQKEGMLSNQINSLYVDQEKGSSFYAVTFTCGGRLVRNEVFVNLKGKHTYTDLVGLFLCTGNQHVDNHTRIDHKMPECSSRELYKGVISGSSTAVFNGKVYVWPDAQKTNAYQSNRNILLSESASVYAKPELEIYADDVKCSHGSATGKLDEEAMFYLRSRGVSKDMARELLVRAFIEEVFEGGTSNLMVDVVKQLMDKWFTRIHNKGKKS